MSKTDSIQNSHKKRRGTRKQSKIKKNVKSSIKKKTNKYGGRNFDDNKYCLCQRQWDGQSLMVQCNICHGWYHPNCVDISTKDAKNKPFTCPQCKPNKRGTKIKPFTINDLNIGSHDKYLKYSIYELMDPKFMFHLQTFLQNNNDAKKYNLEDMNQNDYYANKLIDSNTDLNAYITDDIINDIYKKQLNDGNLNDENELNYQSFTFPFIRDIIQYLYTQKYKVCFCIFFLYPGTIWIYFF